MKKILAVLLLLFIFPLFARAADQVEINTASLQQLETLAGIGATIGQRIIDDRPYASVDDLVDVKGIGDKTLQKSAFQRKRLSAPR